MVELRVSRDLVADPGGHPVLGRPENIDRWLEDNRDLAALDGPRAHRVFMTIAQFPAMRASYLRHVVGGSSAEIGRKLDEFVAAGLVAQFDGRYYLAERGMRRAATLSRVSPAALRRRHGAYLERRYREHELGHNDGLNRLVASFAQEGVAVAAGWRGEVNVPDVTQVRPDLLVPVVAGPHGGGFHFLEYERSGTPRRGENKLRPYRRMMEMGRPLPLLMVCESPPVAEHFLSLAGGLPMLAASMEQALHGPLTGANVVWRGPARGAVELHCLRRNRYSSST